MTPTPVGPGARFEFATAGRVVFGAGTAEEVLPGAVRELSGGGPVLIVTGPRRERWAHLGGLLEARGQVVWLAVSGEPTVERAREGAFLAREARVTVVVAIGGGSAIDAGKAIAALAANSGEPLDYLEVIGAGKPLERRPLPFLAVPTTSGTGAEVTRNAVLGSPNHGVKASLRSAWMLPAVAIVDPELTRELPREVAAYTGLDALTQLIEPLVSVRANPFSDAVAWSGLEAAATGLRRLDRELMARASLASGMALANGGLGAVHGFAAAIGGMFPGTPHGAICAALLAPVMRANIAALQARAPGASALARYGEVAARLTGRSGASPEDGTRWVTETVEELGAKRLSAYGVAAARSAEIVAAARRASSMKSNPVELTDRELAAALSEAM